MSFQDVRRRRQHHIFDNHRITSNSGSSSRESYHQTRKEPMDEESWHKRQQQQKHQQQQQQQSSRDATKPERGVRPRLSTSCPVTAKNLMADQDSLSTQETAPSVETLSSQSDLDVPSIPPIRREPITPRSQSMSMFAHLTTSIANYQVRALCFEKNLEIPRHART